MIKSDLCSSIRHMPSGCHRFLRFGSFEIDADARVLRKSGVKIRLQEQPFAVLMTLLESPGEIVTREKLRQRLWPQGTFVEFDHALNTAVKKIRTALCDDAAVPRYVETIPRRGYRFLPQVDTSASTSLGSNREFAVAAASGLARGRSFRTTIVACALGIPFLMLSAWVISRPSTPKHVTLVVLPFSNMNPASTHESAILPDLLLRQLWRRHPAKLVIRNYINKPVHLLASVESDGSQIDYVVQGGVLGDEQNLHVAVQLIRLSDQNSVWTGDFYRHLDDPQSEIELAEEIVGQMQHTLALLTDQAR